MAVTVYRVNLGEPLPLPQIKIREGFSEVYYYHISDSCPGVYITTAAETPINVFLERSGEDVRGEKDVRVRDSTGRNHLVRICSGDIQSIGIEYHGLVEETITSL